MTPHPPEGCHPEIVLGPPGTGKTTTLLDIVDQELEAGTDPRKIGYFSFTTRAAREAVERACTRFSLERSDLHHFRTLHSMCFNALGLSDGDVLEGKRLTEFGDWLGVKLSAYRRMDEGTSFGYEENDRALFMENLARVRMVPLRQQYDEYSDGLRWNVVERLQRGMQQFKRDRHLVDYTDMLQMFVDQGWHPDLEVLLVDEAQDLSLLQWLVVWLLARGCRRVVLAGDDDQAIYRWAGAAVEYFVGLEGDVRVLEQSYRVPTAVQRTALRLVGQIRHRRTKIWQPRAAAGQVSRLQSMREVDLWGPEVLILVRNAFVAERTVLPQLRSEGVIFDWRGHSSVRQSVLEAIRCWEHLRGGGTASPDEVVRVYEHMSTGVGVQRGHKTLPRLSGREQVGMRDLVEHGGLLTGEIWHQALDRIPGDERAYLVRARSRGETTTGKPRVRVSTIHGSKGGEAEHVVLMRDVALRTWQEARSAPEDEARVWYVGATRAKTQLSIVAPRTKMHYEV